MSYCPMVSYLFIVTDSAVLNHILLESYLKPSESVLANTTKKVTISPRIAVNDSVIAGFCSYNDERLANSLRIFFQDQYKTHVSKSEEESDNDTKNKDKKKPKPSKLKSKYYADVEVSKRYQGQYCSSLGYLLSNNAAKNLWITALNAPYMMRVLPQYVSGYIAFKANMVHTNLFQYSDEVMMDTNCVKTFQSKPDTLLCAENFTIPNRYNNYISTWNTGTQSHLAFGKL
jgi:hypothetical protein